MLKKKYIIGFLCGNILAVFLLMGSSSYFLAHKFPHFQKKKPYFSKQNPYFSPSSSESISSEEESLSSKDLEKSSVKPVVTLTRPLSEEEIQQLEKNVLLLGHEDYKVREDAYKKIVKLKEAAVRVLETYLNHDDLQIRASVQEAITEIQSE